MGRLLRTWCGVWPIRLAKMAAGWNVVKTKREAERDVAREVPTSGERARASCDAQMSLARRLTRSRICRHPEREEIEREFVDWESLREMAKTWGFASYRATYRRAHATGLCEQRRENRRGALDCIIERVRESPVTASAVVAAIRLGERLDREEREGRRAGGRQAEFTLSLDGLPRTNAVTGRAPDEGALEVGLKPAATTDDEQTRKGHGEGALEDRGSGRPGKLPPPNAAARRGGAAAVTGGSAKESKEAETGDYPVRMPANATGDGTGKPLPAELQAIASGADPRVVFGEDGWVAGMPWPKGKVAFARVGRRWRGRRGRPGS